MRERSGGAETRERTWRPADTDRALQRTFCEWRVPRIDVVLDEKLNKLDEGLAGRV